jgi:glycosyltransferase involved in cell wall biosynthesis
MSDLSSVERTAGSRVTVVIPARNAAATLGAQLDALGSQDFSEPYSVIVVDNGSTDATATLRPSNPVDFAVLHEPRPGANAARNAGIAAAGTEYVLLCDADDVVRPEWIRGLVHALENADLVGGWVDTTRFNAAVVRRRWLLDDFHKPEPTPWGCNMGFRRSVWQSVGGFDESIGPSADDIEFGKRAIQLGFRLQMTPDAVVDYRLRPSRRDVLRRSFQNGQVEALIALKEGRGQGMLGGIKWLVRQWAWFIATWPRAMVSTRHRWIWHVKVAGAIGRLAGSIKNRVFYP